MLNLSNRCNLRCGYCFVEPGLAEYSSANQDLSMSEALREATLEFVDHFANGFETVTVHFYGGEPLLEFQAIKDFVASMQRLATSKPKKIRYSITTNGTLIDQEVAEFFGAHGFNVLISMDGPPAVHDTMRRTADGRPTSARVLRAVSLVKAAPGAHLGLSAVIHAQNRLRSAYEYLKSFEPQSIKAEYIRSRRGGPQDLDDRAHAQYVEDLKHISRDVSSALLQGKQPADHRFSSRMLQLWRGVKRRRFCGAGTCVLGIAPNGDIYPCSLFIGYQDRVLGNVRTGLKQEAVEAFLHETSADSRASCRACPDKELCGGGCPAMWRAHERGYCRFIREEISLARQLYQKVHQQESEALGLLVSRELHQRMKAIVNAVRLPGH